MTAVAETGVPAATGAPAATAVPVDTGLRVARGLLTATLVAMLVSTSATVGLEFAVYVVFAWFPSLRQRLFHLLRQPMAIALLVFLAIVALSALHGEAPWLPRLGQVSGWRKALLFFFAAAVFDDAPAKRRLAGIYFAASLALVAVSLLTYFFNFHIYGRAGYGIVVGTYGTQSFVLAIAAGIAAIALIDREQFADDPLLRHWPVALAAIGLFIFDIGFILSGRSGYLALVVMAGVLAVMLGGPSRRTKLLSAAAVVVVLVGVLASSQVVRDRMTLAITEIENVESSTELTSVGIRLILWKHTAQMIADHPLLGVGTGSFHDAYAHYVEGDAGWQAVEGTDPHDQYLKIWAEQGLFGLLAFIAFIVAALAARGLTPYRELGVAILLAVCASSLVNSHFSTFVEGRLLFFWLGALLVAPLGAPALRNPPAKTI